MSLESSKGISQKVLFEYAKACSETTGETGKLEKRLVIRDKKLVFDKISRFEAFQAFFGRGPASLKEVAHFCAKRQISCEELKQKITSYNTNHVFFKQIRDVDLTKSEENQKTRIDELKKELQEIFKNEKEIYDDPQKILKYLEDRSVTPEEFKYLADSNGAISNWSHTILQDPRVRELEPPSAVSLLINFVKPSNALQSKIQSSADLKELRDFTQFLIKHMSLQDYAKVDEFRETFISVLCSSDLLIAECFDNKIPLPLLFMQANRIDSEKPVMLIDHPDKKQDIANAISRHSREELFAPVYKEKSLIDYVEKDVMKHQDKDLMKYWDIWEVLITKIPPGFWSQRM